MFTKLYKKARRNIAERRRYLSTVKELSRLTDRDLKDLGIDRSEIGYVAKKHSVR